jgi:hypothetical protein
MLDLLDYRRRVAEMYYRIREFGTATPEAWQLFQQTRDALFANHPQSPLEAEDRAAFSGLRYYPYDPHYRVIAVVDHIDEDHEYAISAGEDGLVRLRQIGTLSFMLPNGIGSLGVFWMQGYGGGVFIPFRDSTNGQTTYGGGRYLFDTIKGADLGSAGDALVLDFNYAYHPSCCYNPRWTCPLAPQQNRLSFAVEAGERLADA